MPISRKIVLRPDGEPDEAYEAAVKRRFVQWVLDARQRPRDQAWLDYQQEIGLHHTPEKKNKSDGAHTPDKVPLRYVSASAWPVIIGPKTSLGSKGHSSAEVERMHRTWTKSEILHLALWAEPYARQGLW